MVTKNLEDMIIDKQPIERYCCGCYHHTAQIPIEIEDPKYPGCHTYQCQSCRSIRYYEVIKNGEKIYKKIKDKICG